MTRDSEEAFFRRNKFENFSLQMAWKADQTEKLLMTEHSKEKQFRKKIQKFLKLNPQFPSKLVRDPNLQPSYIRNREHIVMRDYAKTLSRTGEDEKTETNKGIKLGGGAEVIAWRGQITRPKSVHQFYYERRKKQK